MHPKDNTGKREREAGKRHRRARILGADQSPLKLGRKKHRIWWCKALQCRTPGHQSVADTESNA